MKAPDKIYIDVGTISSNIPNECYALPGWHEKPNPKMANEEYIRKEALIEWLNDSIKEMDESRKKSVAYSLQSMAGAIAISSFIEVKNKINSL